MKSVRPFINVDSHLTPENYLYRIRLENHGLGPALLEKVQIVFNGNNFPSFYQMFENNPLILSEVSKSQIEWSQLVTHTGPAGHWLRAGGEMDLLLYQGNFMSIYKTIHRTISGCMINVTFSDVYENKYSTSEVI